MLKKFLLLCCFLATILCEKTNNQALALPLPDRDPLPEILTPSIASNPESQLLEVLETVNQMDDSPAKANLLNDIALKYIELGRIKEAEEILAKSWQITNILKDQTVQVNLLTNIAKQYAQIGQLDKAQEILELTVKIANSVEDKLTQGQLLLAIALTYQSINLEDSSATLISQGQTLIKEASQPVAEYPFQEERAEFRLGFAGSIYSFRETTASLGTNTNYYKQWSEADLLINGRVSVSFDSGRTNNKYRPNSFANLVYRSYFNQKLHLFTDLFFVTNEELFASRNESDDLTIIASSVVGVGLNLWRGETPKESLDIQFGFGPRYEYDFIDFEKRRDRLDPILSLVFSGRRLKIGRANINQLFGIFPSLRDSENLIMTSNTTLSIPITERWSFTNQLFFRYRNQTIFEDNPKWNFYFTTGLDFKF